MMNSGGCLMKSYEKKVSRHETALLSTSASFTYTNRFVSARSTKIDRLEQLKPQKNKVLRLIFDQNVYRFVFIKSVCLQFVFSAQIGREI